MTGQERSDALIGARVVPAVAVLLGHAAPVLAVLLPPLRVVLEGIERSGYIAVDMFFVLSGFGISSGYADRFRGRFAPLEHLRFLWMRLARLYPTHVVVLGLLGVVAVTAPLLRTDLGRHDTTPITFAQHFFLVQGWGLSSQLSWNGPTWSLSAEWACYLVFPAIAYVCGRVRRSWAVGLGCAALATTCFAVYAVVGTEDAQLTYQAPLVRAFCGFTIGCLVYRGSRCALGSARVCGRLCLLFFAAAAVSAPLLYLAGLPPLWSSVFLAPTVLGLSQRGYFLQRLLGRRALVHAGRLTTAVYLVQVPWLMLLARLPLGAALPGPLLGTLGSVLVLASTVAVAVLAQRCVELPAHRVLRRLWRRGPGVTAADG